MPRFNNLSKSIFATAASRGVSGKPEFIDVLVIAGGGGGSGNNGSGAGGDGAGGAGGYLYYGSLTPTTGKVFTGAYTVTVGAGGNSALATFNAGKGGNSSFSGSQITTILAYGGGAACYGSSGTNPDSNGGSGGGGGANSPGSGGKGIYPGSSYISLSPRQGYDGGVSGGQYQPAGGGGAGGQGGIFFAGAGISNTITGTAVLYAQGGGGIPATSNVNTGEGGSTNTTNDPRPGLNGIVVVRYLDGYDAASSYTGSPNVIVSGGYRIYRFTGTGSITF